MNHLDDSFEDIRAVLFDVGHEFLDFLVFRFVDYELIGLFHEIIQLFSKFRMCKQCVADFDIAVVLVLSLFVGSQELHEILVGLHILVLESFQPLLRCFYVYLF